MRRHEIGVKDLVVFLYGSGDLTSQTANKRMRYIGQNLHAMRQASYGTDDEKEVFVEAHFSSSGGMLKVSGRIDGVLKRDGGVVLEEIKSTETALELIGENTFPAHKMQGRLYAYMYCRAHGLKSVTLWLTYIHHPSHKTKTIIRKLRLGQLENTVAKAVDEYRAWLALHERHRLEKTKTIEGLRFPHDETREGQHAFMGAVYQALMKKDIVYATAPTGIGKTVAALFSALKTLKTEREKIFYLTAKNAGKTIAVKTIEHFKENGLSIKAITLNSKENMCLMDDVDCDPELCPYAKGYYDRLKDALSDIFIHEDVYDARLIKEYGEYRTICPHEFALDISLYCDVIVCDYNYVFDPRVKLVRYFEETAHVPKLLIDEAHNLVDRTRAMYSASIRSSDIETLRGLISDFKPALKTAVVELQMTMDKFIHDATAEVNVFDSIEESFMAALERLASELESVLDTHKRHPKRQAIREGYFLLLQFARVAEYFTDAFRFIVERSETDAAFNIVCLDASTPVSSIIGETSHGTVLFSATLKPFEYFANLLTKGKGQWFEVPSPFDPKRLGLMIDVSTSTKYKARPQSVGRIIDTLHAMLITKPGNYIAFFPSYEYMQMILDAFDGDKYEILIHTRGMSLFERHDCLNRFKEFSNRPKILFSVLGGSFSEGVDYMGDTLSGVLVVGVALPAMSTMNELLKDYYNACGYAGFDYAYTFPGMNKVIQAVGRVIRDPEDKGIAILLDTRYALATYKRLMPAHWRTSIIRKRDFVQSAIRAFWEKQACEDCVSGPPHDT